MYLFITRNNPYFGDLNKNPQSEGVKDLDNIEIDLKSKEKLPEEDFAMDEDISQNKEDLEDTKSEKTEDETVDKLKNEAEDAKTKDDLSKRKIKIFRYKLVLHSLAIFSSSFLIISAILCQIENDYFTKDNKYIRNIASLIISAIYYKGKDQSWEYIFDDKRISLVNAIDNKCESVSVLCNNIEPILMSNEYFLNIHNITKNTFKYVDGMTNYKLIEVPLEISSKCNKLRVFILIMTILSTLSMIAMKYILYLFEDIFIKEKNNPFYKSKYFLFMILEIVFMNCFQFPGMNSFLLYDQSDSISILPISSILSSITIFRLLYIIRIINSLMIYDSAQMDDIYDKYSLRPSCFFTFKATQKKHPFITLFVLFFLVLIVLSLFMRVFEIHYWESQIDKREDWNYYVNPMWVIFSSMMTIGYGDLYPRTHPGRVVVIISCFLGIYFIAMTMIYMTKKSILSENEQKSYKLITRIKLRNQLKNINAQMIHHFVLMVILKKKYDKRKLKEKEYLVKQNYERRVILSIIENSKQLDEKLKAFDFIPTKEQLTDISERIEYDIKEIKKKVEDLRINNSYLFKYVMAHKSLIRYLRKSIFNTKLIFGIISRKPEIFGDLERVDKIEMQQELSKIYATDIALSDNMKKEDLFEKGFLDGKVRRRTNPQQYEGYDESNSSEDNRLIESNNEKRRKAPKDNLRQSKGNKINKSR
ncbi:MAG: potassium channel family protein, partial [archaeon]|nr:potassium channel family protein [archaeon]